MTEIPKTLEAAIAQSREATQAAIADGLTRLQVELVFPELKPMPVAQQFVEVFADLGANLKVYFPDAGAAALARRDWGELPFEVRGIGEIKGKIQPEDQAFILVAPSSVEVVEVEKICEEVGDRPVIMLNPRLEDISTIGIGYAGRQLRERFLNTFETCYYLRPLEQAALLRCYPAPWQVWLENQDDYQLVTEVAQRPVGEDLDRLLTRGSSEANDQPVAPPPKAGFFKDLQRLLKALGQ